MFNADDDDDFGVTRGGGKLASIFGAGKVADSDASSSLRYNAPKQPKPRTAASAPSGRSAPSGGVVTAARVNAFRHVDGGGHVNEGQLGAALVASAENRIDLILYKSNKQTVAVSPVSADGPTLTIRDGIYVQFADTTAVSWSLGFDAAVEAARFCANVALSRALYADGPEITSLRIMDVTPGEGAAVTDADGVEVKYTGWAVEGPTLAAKPFDSNIEKESAFRVKVIRQASIIPGWIKGLVGLRRGAQRFLVIPASLGYGKRGSGDGRIAPDTPLVFHIRALRVKVNKDSVKSRTNSLLQHQPEPTISLTEADYALGEDDDALSSVSERGSTVSLEEGGKKSLLSRMARMGQAILPPPTATSTAAPEVEERTTHDLVPDIPKEPESVASGVIDGFPPVMIMTPQGLVRAPFSAAATVNAPINTFPATFPPVNSTLPPASTQALAPYQPPISSVLYGSAYSMGPQVVANPAPETTTPPTTASTVDSQLAPILISETRQQNTEVRMSLAKVLDKIEEVGRAVTALEKRSLAPTNDVAGSVNVVEANVLQLSINRIVEENSAVKEALFAKSKKVEELNKKIGEILLENQSFVEKSHERLAARNSSLASSSADAQSRVLELERERLDLTQKLSETVAELADSRRALADAEAALTNNLGAAEESRFKLVEVEKKLVTMAESERAAAAKALSASERAKLAEKEAKVTVEKLSVVEEELAETRASHERLKAVHAEQKDKWERELSAAEKEVEETKKRRDEAIEELKSRIRKERSDTDSAASHQIAEAEKQLEEEFRERARRREDQMREKFEGERREMREEAKAREETLEAARRKMAQLKEALIAQRSENQRLVDEAEDIRAWQEKYKKLYSNVGILKQRFEEKLAEGEGEREALEKNIKELKKALKTLKVESTAAISPDFSSRVKKILNRTYHELKQEVDPTQTYTGEVVHRMLLETIKRVTLASLDGATDVRSQRSPVKREVNIKELEQADQSAEDFANASQVQSHREDNMRAVGVAKAAAYVDSLKQEGAMKRGSFSSEGSFETAVVETDGVVDPALSPRGLKPSALSTFRKDEKDGSAEQKVESIKVIPSPRQENQLTEEESNGKVVEPESILIVDCEKATRDSELEREQKTIVAANVKTHEEPMKDLAKDEQKMEDLSKHEQRLEDFANDERRLKDSSEDKQSLEDYAKEKQMLEASAIKESSLEEAVLENPKSIESSVSSWDVIEEKVAEQFGAGKETKEENEELKNTEDSRENEKSKNMELENAPTHNEEEISNFSVGKQQKSEENMSQKELVEYDPVIYGTDNNEIEKDIAGVEFIRKTENLDDDKEEDLPPLPPIPESGAPDIIESNHPIFPEDQSKSEPMQHKESIGKIDEKDGLDLFLSPSIPDLVSSTSSEQKEPILPMPPLRLPDPMTDSVPVLNENPLEKSLDSSALFEGGKTKAASIGSNQKRSLPGSLFGASDDDDDAELFFGGTKSRSSTNASTESADGKAGASSSKSEVTFADNAVVKSQPPPLLFDDDDDDDDLDWLKR